MQSDQETQNALVDRVSRCLATRELAISFVAENLIDGESEAATRDRLLQKLKNQPELLGGGWYSPPPDGISVLFGKPTDMQRLNFDSLRNPEYWPSDKNILEPETAGMVYMSPVDRASGTIGDIGLTFYRGDNVDVQQQVKLAYDVNMQMCELAEVGMSFRELFDPFHKILAKNGASHGRMALVNDPSGMNFGHTVPWSHELPTPGEQAAIDRGSIDELRDIISAKRIYINNSETFRIPETCAFTVEPHVVTVDEAGHEWLSYFHFIVAFRNGQRTIVGDYQPLFHKLGMNYMMDDKEER
jgi:hypothetical protein